MKKIFNYILVLVSCAGLFTACNLDIAPADSLTGNQMMQSPSGLTDILNGCYATMKDFPTDADSHNNWYGRQFFQMSDFSSDDVVYGHSTSDELNFIFKFDERHAGLGNVASFWSQSYKIIYATNVALDVINQETELDNETKCLKGEALFLKAFCMHNLIRYYSKYYNPATAGSDYGIVIRENGSDAQPKERASVQDSYDYVVACLTEAEELMKEGCDRATNRSFASVGAVRALLSRVYLDMQQYDKCIEYSTKVINDSNYALEDAEGFKTYFTHTYASKETVWCLKMLPQDDKLSAALASMVYKAEGCWGEEGYSEPLLQAMGKGTGVEDFDVRWSFVCPINAKNGLDLIPTSKLSNQDGSPTLVSHPFLRISEMYFNRAEAYAKQNKDAEALADINTVRKNRLTAHADSYLYTTADAKDGMIELILKEKRAEFAFEGLRFFDLIRNGKDIVRDYWGYHTIYNGSFTTPKPTLDMKGVVIKCTDPKVVFPIPAQEMDNNPLCQQNEGY